jgi:hypothetical protein
MSITNRDLYRKKYSIEIIELNVDDLEIRTMLSTQVLTAEFCVKYILNDDYVSTVEERYICDSDVLFHQKHLTQQDLSNARIKLGL